jgi:hypothetical protein
MRREVFGVWVLWLGYFDAIVECVVDAGHSKDVLRAVKHGII